MRDPALHHRHRPQQEARQEGGRRVPAPAPRILQVYFTRFYKFLNNFVSLFHYNEKVFKIEGENVKEILSILSAHTYNIETFLHPSRHIQSFD